MKFLAILQTRFDEIGAARVGLLFTLTLLSTLYSAVPSRAQPYQGFGANTPGGTGQPLYRVTNLSDSGPGSLRDGLSQGNRHIVFDVAGEISLLSRLFVRGANITIDGFTAPPPGITIKNYSLKILGSDGAHDVIVQGVRVQIVNSVAGAEDGITVGGGAYNIVIDHVSVRGASDENIGINNARDVTVSWSILAAPMDSHNANMLITEQTTRVSVHHNLFVKARRRSPDIAYSDIVQAPEVQADVRNNLMWDVSGGGSHHGTVVFGGGKANIVHNYYKAADGAGVGGQKRVIVICKAAGNTSEDMSFCGSRVDLPAARAYVTGNFSADGWTNHINAKGTETEPFPVPPVATVATTNACSAAHQVLAQAGVTPRDSIDEQYLSAILPSLCPEITSPVPGSVLTGANVTFSWAANGADVRNWRLYVGSTQGAKDLHDSGTLSANKTSMEVRRLPTDGRVIWVQIRFDVGGSWEFVDFQYTARK